MSVFYHAIIVKLMELVTCFEEIVENGWSFTDLKGDKMTEQCNHKFNDSHYNPKATIKFCIKCNRWINTKYLDNVRGSAPTLNKEEK